MRERFIVHIIGECEANGCADSEVSGILSDLSTQCIGVQTRLGVYQIQRGSSEHAGPLRPLHGEHPPPTPPPPTPPLAFLSSAPQPPYLRRCLQVHGCRIGASFDNEWRIQPRSWEATHQQDRMCCCVAEITLSRAYVRFLPILATVCNMY